MMPKFLAVIWLIVIIGVVFAMAAVVSVAAEPMAVINPTLRMNSMPQGVSIALKAHPDWVRLPGHVVSKLTDGNVYCEVAIDPRLLKSKRNRQVIQDALIHPLDDKRDLALWLYLESLK